jgi:drug/metabolite transporter (DMT)-like permease
VETLSVALFILGLLLTLAGVAFVFLGRFDDPPEKEGDSVTAGDVLERLNGAIEKVEKRYRWGVVMLGLGLALIGAGAWAAAMAAASAASMPAPPPPG